MTSDIHWHSGATSRERRWAATGGQGATVWLTGLSGSGKSSIAFEVEKRLVTAGRASYVLDGDNLRHGLNADLGFSPSDRQENVRRVGEVALLLADAGLVVLAPLVSPYMTDRRAVREAHEAAGLPFLEVFVDTPIEVCIERDPKGLYAKAARGELSGLTGVDSPYEAPASPEVWVKTVDQDLDAASAVLEKAILGL